MAYSGQFFVFIESIPTQAHDHRVYLGLFLVERTRGWAVDLVVGATSGDLGVTEVYARGCYINHLRKRIVWQIGYSLGVNLCASFIGRWY